MEVDISELRARSAACRAELEEAFKELRHTEPLQLEWTTFRRDWSAYYSGVFARLDETIMNAVYTRTRGYQRFVPVAISHHNLQRLVEVLDSDMTSGAVVDLRVPERLGDLTAMCDRLLHLVGEVSGDRELESGDPTPGKAAASSGKVAQPILG
jgi:hypothetical protein